MTLNASCMTILGEITEQLDIFCRITGFTSDFLSFMDVELIRFFHRAIQFTYLLTYLLTKPLSTSDRSLERTRPGPVAPGSKKFIQRTKDPKNKISMDFSLPWNFCSAELSFLWTFCFLEFFAPQEGSCQGKFAP